LMPFFLVGSILSRFSKNIHRLPFFIIFVILLYQFNNSWFSLPLLWILLPYCVIFLALKLPRPFKNWSRYGDFSFGIYLYAFPIQQIISNSKLLGDSHIYIVLMSSIVTCIFAYFSWHLVESPSMTIRRRLIISLNNCRSKH